MRLFPALLCAWIVPAAAFAAPQSLESLAASAGRDFLEVPSVAPMQAAASIEPWFIAPDPKAVPPSEALGAEAGRVKLADRLDRHVDLLKLQLGPSTWDVSVAGDPSFKNYFLTFRQGSRLVIAPLGDVNRLRNEGIDATIEPGVSYHFHVSIYIFDPVRGSTLEVTPNDGTEGPEHNIKTGVLLDAIKSKSFVFSVGGKEYWMLYGTDVDAKTNTRLDSRSLLFFHQAGISSKGWPLAESSLPVGQATGVSFGDQKVVLERTAGGELVIRGR